MKRGKNRFIALKAGTQIDGTQAALAVAAGFRILESGTSLVEIPYADTILAADEGCCPIMVRTC